MKTIAYRSLTLMLLGAALLMLPACGSNSTVKSEKQPETVLNTESTPTTEGNTDLGSPNGGDTSVRAYVQHTGKKQKSNPSVMPLTASPAPTASTSTTTQAPASTPSMETAAPVKKASGSHWLLWAGVVVVLGGVGWFFWSRGKASDHPDHPMPPVGGLSPVSGYTAVKDHIEDSSENEPSFWSKKIF